MANFKNGIQIDINLTDENTLIQNLQKTIEALNKEAILDLKLDTKGLISSLKDVNKVVQELNKSLSQIDFKTFNSLSAKTLTDAAKGMGKLDKVFNDFIGKSGIESGEEFAKEFKEAFKQGLQNGDIKKTLDSAITFNEKAIYDKFGKELDEEYKNLQSFFKEIGVLVESSAKNAKGKLVSAMKGIDLTSVLDKDEIKELGAKLGRIWTPSKNGMDIEQHIGEWVDVANKHMITLSGNSSEAAYQLAELVKRYRDFKDGVVNSEHFDFPLSSEDLVNMEGQIAKAYNSMIDDLIKIGHQLGENNKATEEEYLGLAKVNEELREKQRLLNEEYANEAKNSSAKVTKDTLTPDGNLIGRVETFEDSAGRTRQEIQRINQETQELETLYQTITIDREKEAKINQQIDKILEDITQKTQKIKQNGIIEDSKLDKFNDELAKVEGLLPSSNKLTALKELNDQIKKLVSEEKDIKKFNNIIEDLQNKLQKATSNQFIDSTVLDYWKKELSNLSLDSTENEINKVKNAITNLASSEDMIVKLQNKFTNLNRDFKDTQGKFDNIISSNSVASIDKFKDSLEKVHQLLLDAQSGSKVSNSTYNDLMNEVSNAQKDMNSELQNIQKTQDAVENVKNTLKDSKNDLDDLHTKFSDVIGTEAQSELQKYNDAMNDLNDIIDRFSRGDSVGLKEISEALDNMKNSSKDLTKSLNQAQNDFLKNEKMEDGIARLQKQLNSLGGYVDTKFVDQLQVRIDSITTDNAKKEIAALTQELAEAKTAETQIRKLQNQIMAMEEVAKKAGQNLSQLSDPKGKHQLQEYVNRIEDLKKTMVEISGNGQSLNSNIFADMQTRANDLTSELRSTVKEIESLIELQDKLKGQIDSVRGGSIYSDDSLDKLQTQIDAFNTDTAQNEIDELVNRINALGKNSSALEEVKRKLELMVSPGLVNESVITGLQNRLDAINTDTAEEEIKDLIKMTERLYNTSEPQIRSVQKLYDSLTAKLKQAKEKFKDIIDNGSVQEVAKLEEEISKLSATLQNLKLGSDFNPTEIRRQMDEASQAATNMSSALRDMANQEPKGIKAILSSLKEIMVISVDMSDLIGIFKDAARHVMEVEDALTSLRRVTEMSDETARKFTKTIGEQAQAIGTDTNTLMQAVTIFRKLGYSLTDATDMAVITQKYDYAADINNIEESANSLVATLKGFKLEASEITNVADSIDQVANNFALNAGDINEMLLRSSATMKSFNNSLEQTIALGTTANEIVQDASRVGNSMKSLAPRLTTNEQALIALEKLGVSIERSNGQLKSTYEIIEDIGKSWESMPDDISKASLANDLFGKNQMTVGLAMIENYTRLKEVMQSIKEGEGIVDTEFSKRMDTTSAKVEQLKQTVNQIWENTIDSDFTKAMVDGLNELLKVIGNIPTAIGLCTAALIVFKGELVKNVILGAISGLASVTSSVYSVVTATKTLKEAVAGLNLVSSMNKYVLIATLIAGVTLAIAGLAKSVRDADRAIITNGEVIAQEIDNLKVLEHNLTSLEKNWDKFMSNELDTSDREEFTRVNEKIIEQYPELLSYYDAEHEMYVVNIEKAREWAKEKQKALMMDNAKNIAGADDAIKKQEDKIKFLQERINSVFETPWAKKWYKDAQTKAQETIDGINETVASSVKYIANYSKALMDEGKTYAEVLNELGEIGYSFDQVNNVFNKLGGDFQGRVVYSEFQLLISAVREFNTTGKLTEDTMNTLNKAFPNMGLSTENVKEKMKELTSSVAGNSESLQQIMQDFEDYGTLTKEQMRQLAVAFPDLELDVNKLSAEAVAENLYLIRNALTELDNTGTVSAETLRKVQSAFPGMAIDASNAGAALMELRYQAENNQVSLEKMMTTFQEKGELTTAQIQKLQEIFPGLSIDASNAGDVLFGVARHLQVLGAEAQTAEEQLESLTNTLGKAADKSSVIDSILEDLSDGQNTLSVSTWENVLKYEELLGILATSTDVYGDLRKEQEKCEKEMQNAVDTALALGAASMEAGEKGKKAAADVADATRDAAEDSLLSHVTANEQIIQNSADTVDILAENYATDAGNKQISDVDKSISDADMNDTARQNSADTTTIQGENYSISTQNHGISTSDKSIQDADFNDTARQNAWDTTNETGDAYGTMAQNHGKATDSMIDQADGFKGFWQKIAEWLSKLFGKISKKSADLAKTVEETSTAVGDSTGKTIANALSNTNNIGIDTSGAPSASAYKGKGNSNINSYGVGKTASSSKSGSSGGKKGSSGSSSGKSQAQREAEKAAEEAQRWKEKIDELNASFETDRYFYYNRQLQDIANEFNNLSTAREMIKEGSLEYTASLEKEIELLEKKRFATGSLAGEQRREAQELQDYLKKYNFFFDANGTLYDYENRILELQKETNALAGDTEEAYKKKQEWVEWIKELEQKTSRYVELTHEIIPKAADDWEKLSNEIKKTQKAIKDAQTSLVKDLRDQLAAAILKKAQETKEDLEDEYKKLEEKKKKQLEDEYNSKVKILKQQVEALKKELKDLDDTETDKRKKLAALQEELKAWQRDDSVNDTPYVEKSA